MHRTPTCARHSSHTCVYASRPRSPCAMPARTTSASRASAARASRSSSAVNCSYGCASKCARWDACSCTSRFLSTPGKLYEYGYVTFSMIYTSTKNIVYNMMLQSTKLHADFRQVVFQFDNRNGNN